MCRKKNYKNSATNKLQNLDNIIKDRWEKVLYFSSPTTKLSNSCLNVFVFEPWVLLDYAFYGELPPENTPSRIMQSFVGWKRLLDADAKKYDRRKKDRFAGKTHADNGQETKPQNNKNKTRNKQKAGKKRA